MPDVHGDTQLDAAFAGLTAAQRQAVEHVDGPLLVIAGPGSGKTRTITSRIANLVLGVGIAPWNVLALTFTNKAAGEMRDRVASMLSERQARAVTCTTFHSLCARLMRQYGERLGLDPRYSIYDTSDQQRVIKQTYELLDIGSSNFPPSKSLSSISNAKNELIGPEEYETYARDFYSKKIARVYRKYQQILKQNNALDFDDLLLNMVTLVREHPDVMAELRERFQYILIDEYQDTNHAQFVIANGLAGEHKNLCATGDPDQSIYRWRGADIRNILEFEQNYPDATVVRLEQNYRSTKHILAAADGLIQNNTARKHKALWTDNDEGDRVVLVCNPDERSEARWMADTFRDLHDQQDLPWGSMAVFYRTNSLSRVVEDELRDSGIPYQIARGTAFYDRKEVKDAVAYLRAVSNPADEVNLLRIINTPARGISSNTVKAMQAAAIAGQCGVPDIIASPGHLPSLNVRAVKAVSAFDTMLQQWRKETESIEATLRGFVEQVLRESGLQDFYAKDSADPDSDRLMNLGELVSGAQQFEDELALGDEHLIDAPLARRLEAFLERISLVSDVDAVESGQGAVTLMTLHAAKGLEFAVVVMVGVEDGLLPHANSQSDKHEIEEERRLCFVGITRAERKLFLSYTRRRTIFGQTMPVSPSRFLRELPEEHIEIIEEDDGYGDVGDGMSPWDRGRQRTAASREAQMYPPGTRVRHPQFGDGRVLSVAAAGMQTRARIEFSRVGVKTLVLQYARLEIVDNGPVTTDPDYEADGDLPF